MAAWIKLGLQFISMTAFLTAGFARFKMHDDPAALFLMLTAILLELKAANAERPR